MTRVFSTRKAMVAVLLLAGSSASAIHPQDGASLKPVPFRPNHAQAEQAFLAGARLVDGKDLAGAQEQFARAAALDPTHTNYALAFDLVRQDRIGALLAQAASARIAGKPGDAERLMAEARLLNPGDVRVLEHEAVAADRRPKITRKPEPTFAPPIHVIPNPVSRSFDQRGDVRTIVTAVAQAYGVRAVYDDSVQPQDLHFLLEAAPYGQTMPILLHVGHLFSVPVDDHTILVAHDTEENRERLERQVEETIYIPGASSSQLDELTQVIKNVFDLSAKQVAIARSSGTIVLRGPEETIKAVNYTVAEIVDGGAQVMLQVRLYTINRSITRDIGVSNPSSVSAFSVGAEAQSIVANNAAAVAALISSGAYVPTGNAAQDILAEALYLVLAGVVTDAKVTNLISIFGGGISLFGVDVGSGVRLNLGLNSSDTRALDDINVRVGDGEETTLRVGERYPITTSTYSSGISSSTASLLGNTTINGVSASQLLNQYLGSGTASTIPVIQYEDLGITFKTTPRVMKSGLISLQVSLKLESLQGGMLDNIPVLNSSLFTSTITLKDGSTAIMLSDLTSSASAAVSGLPGLGELPGFSDTIGGTKTRESEHSELVLLVTPRLVRRRSDALASHPYVFHTSVPVDY